MISKKLLQAYILRNNNNNIIRKIIYNKKNFSINLNLHFSHMPNSLPLEPLKSYIKIIPTQQKENLENSLLKKLTNYSDSIAYSVLKKNLTNDFEQIENYKNSHFVPKEISDMIDSIKNFKPFFINDFIAEILKNKEIPTPTLVELENKGNEINDKIFLNEFTNQKEDIKEIISFAESFIKFLYKFNYYDNINHKFASDENKIFQLKKLDHLRNIFECLNFEQLNNSELIRLLPCLIVFQRIFNFSSLVSNSFNTTVTRLLQANNYIIDDALFINSAFLDERVLLVKKNSQLLHDYIKYIFTIFGNFTIVNYVNINNVFPNFESLLTKFVYLKDIMVEKSDINYVVFLLTENILQFNYSLSELHKLDSNKNGNSEKTINFLMLFKEFFLSYANYAVMIASQQNKLGANEKTIEINLLKRFINSLLLLKKSESEYPLLNILKDDAEYKIFLQSFVEVFFKSVFAKKDTFNNYVLKAEGMLNLMELDYLFGIKNYDINYSLQAIKDSMPEKFFLKEVNTLDFIKYASEKYEATNINKLIMNILLKEKIITVFTGIELAELSQYLLNLEKFQVKSLSNYFIQIKKNLNSNLKSLDLKSHFNFLYISTKLNHELSPLSSPLYITFLLKLNEKNIDKTFDDCEIKLAWVLGYYCCLELQLNVFFEVAMEKMMKKLRTSLDWIKPNSVGEVLDILIMLNHLKSYDVKVPTEFLEYFDGEIIARLLNYYYIDNNNPFYNKKIKEFLDKEKDLKYQTNKNSNIFFVDYIIELERKKVPIMLVNDFDFNHEGELCASPHLRRNHLEDYFKTKVILFNTDKINTSADLKDALNPSKLQNSKDNQQQPGNVASSTNKTTKKPRKQNNKEN